MTLPRSTVAAIIDGCRERALQMIADGTDAVDAAAWCEAEMRARLRGVDAGWGEAKIQRRAKLRYLAGAAWRFGKKLPIRPFGGAGVAAGNLVEATIRRTRGQLGV